MMRIVVHIGPSQVGATRLQQVLSDKRGQLISKGILFPRSAGPKNHTRLYMAITDPDHVDPLRFNRGYITANKQKSLYDSLTNDLARDVAKHDPETLIFSASQFGSSLYRVSELERLKSFLTQFSDEIRIVAHVDEQARVLSRHYGAQIGDGRAVHLTRDLAFAGAGSWWDNCVASMPTLDPQVGVFEETQGAPFWLDYAALVAYWEQVFGANSVTLRPYDRTRFASEAIVDEICATFDIADSIGKTAAQSLPSLPSSAWLTRGRQLNDLLLQVLATRNFFLPRQLWRKFFNEISVAGDPIDPGSLSSVSKHFAQTNETLVKNHPTLSKSDLNPARTTKEWTEADPQFGYRASQYLTAFMFSIQKATKLDRMAKSADAAPVNANETDLTPIVKKLMPPLAIENYEKLKNSHFAPHNRMGTVDEGKLAAAYSPVPMRVLPEGKTGNVIVGCMKNETPYIVEWIAYHRAIGVDNFLIYTNDCSDGTSEMLDRLQQMGVLQHRNNNGWKGNSPQQYALNQSLKEPVIQNADWIIHIDVDEFMNVRTGNGTLKDFFDAVPNATNVAMTWRMFGHNGISKLADELVIDQFDTCAPKYCPKPHTVWGFKTMFKNIGAYEKISCHRPNKLNEPLRSKVHWVNGSGQDMTKEAADNGWRNSRKSIGYDLLQLNHYALRSAESYLIKRQRGRALHVDRSIGLNYWIRMDWSDHRDITIKRNLPRVQTEYDRLMTDTELLKWHKTGLEWHRAKAIELHGMPEFEDLYQQAINIKLNETERVAYALALDTDS